MSVLCITFLGITGKILMSFSIYTNGKKILTTDQPKGSLTCIHGIRFLSMTWVILGHSYEPTIIQARTCVNYIKVL